MYSYVNLLLPALRKIHSESVDRPYDEKLSAVKLAADTSLAVVVGGNCVWRKALLQVARTSMKDSRSLRASDQTCGGPTSKLLRSLRRRMSRRSSLRKGGRRNEGNAYSISMKQSRTGRWSGYGITDSAYKNHHQLRRSKRSLHQNGLPSYLKVLRRLRRQRTSARRSNICAMLHEELNGSPSMAFSKEHVECLGGLVPGGRSMDISLLLQETAEYIIFLQMQVEALQSLFHHVSS
ncbi:hypothetical protein KP509_04G057100 [Ceratopteris richardii]|nr:hypothetical protein KP509_04G057100 [Ceratopteris richardii]